MNDFKNYLQRKGFSPSTQKSTLRIVNDFFGTSSHGQTEDLNTTKKDILNYLERLQNEGKQSTTRNIYLRAVRYYFAFLLDSGQITSNPANFIKIRGVKRRKLHNIFTADELTRLADDYYHNFIRNFDLEHIPESLQQYAILSRHRNYCMLTFLIYQGLSTNELNKIVVDDIDLIKATVKISAGGRTNARTLRLKAEQIGVLMHYTQSVRPQLLEHYTEETEQFFLLSSKHGYTRTTAEKYGNAFNYFKIQLQSINTSFSNFKQIRASVITGWIQTEGLRKAQYYAGHRYTSSTENYLPNDIEQLSDDIEKYNPF